jgi:hypothetical protein
VAHGPLRCKWVVNFGPIELPTATLLVLVLVRLLIPARPKTGTGMTKNKAYDQEISNSAISGSQKRRPDSKSPQSQ